MGTVTPCTDSHVSEMCTAREHAYCSQVTSCMKDGARVFCDCTCHIPIDLYIA